jgi:hypothetical protein
MNMSQNHSKFQDNKPNLIQIQNFHLFQKVFSVQSSSPWHWLKDRLLDELVTRQIAWSSEIVAFDGCHVILIGGIELEWVGATEIGTHVQERL